MLGGGGTVSPGTSPGVLTIDGNYVQGAGGTLAIEIAGVGAGTQYDQLIVTGNASLGGNLNVALIGGFIPAPGSTFTVVQAGGSVSGTFSGVSMPSFPILTASYPASGVNVTASAAPNTDPILNEQVHASQDAPPTSPVEPGNTNSISPGAPGVPNYYLETDGGQTVPLSITPTVPTGIYVNLETGQTA